MRQVAQMHLRHGRAGLKPTQIIVHAMGEYSEQGERDLSARDLLDKLELSAHAFVTPSGVVIRGRDDDEVAWHARGANFSALGIEFLVPGLHTYKTFVDAIKKPYVSAEQLRAGIAQMREWIEAFGIDRADVLRHSDLSPTRKVDPGDGFPWVEMMRELFDGG